ncbi:MAG: hypothetical protein Q9170_002692 [Blastenia crenularia]
MPPLKSLQVLRSDYPYLGVGLEIPAIKLEKTASLNDAPNFEASLNYTVITTDVGVNGNNDCVNRTGYNVELVNSVYADLFGLAKFQLHRSPNQYPTAVDDWGAQATGGSRKRSMRTQGLIDASNTKRASRLQARRKEDKPGDWNNYVTSIQTNSTPANDAISQAVQNASFVILATTPQTTDGSQVVNPPDTDFLTIHHFSGNNELVVAADGKIYYVPPGNGSIFAQVSGFVEGDGSGRFFHHYPDTMEAYNVSRLTPL